MGDADSIPLSTLLGIVAGLFGIFWTMVLAPHVYRILRPSIVAYPWDESNSSSDQEMSTVVFAASYNPPHHGHLRMLEYLSKKYDKVIAVVGFNPNKKYLVSPEERAGLLREMLQSRTKNVTVEGMCVCVCGTSWLVIFLSSLVNGCCVSSKNNRRLFG